jgi:hypothetical protein
MFRKEKEKGTHRDCRVDSASTHLFHNRWDHIRKILATRSTLRYRMDFLDRMYKDSAVWTELNVQQRRQGHGTYLSPQLYQDLLDLLWYFASIGVGRFCPAIGEKKRLLRRQQVVLPNIDKGAFAKGMLRTA